MYSRCLARAGRGRLLVIVSATFCGPYAFQQLDVAIAYKLPQIVHSLHLRKSDWDYAGIIWGICWIRRECLNASVNMPGALPISRIFAHHNKRGIIFPYFWGADLSEIETPQQRSQINGYLARLWRWHKFGFSAAESDTALSRTAQRPSGKGAACWHALS